MGRGRKSVARRPVRFTWPCVEFLLPLWFRLYNNSEMPSRNSSGSCNQILIEFPVLQTRFSGKQSRRQIANMSQRCKMCKKSKAHRHTHTHFVQTRDHRTMYSSIGRGENKKKKKIWKINKVEGNPNWRQSDLSQRGEEHPGCDFVRSYLAAQTKMSKHPIPGPSDYLLWVIVWKVNYETVVWASSWPG